MMPPMHPMLKSGYGPAQVAAAHAVSATMARNAAMNQMNQLAMAQHAHEMYGQGMYGMDFHDGSMRKKKKTGGRKHGSQGYTKQDVKSLLDLIDVLKPVDREGWEQVNAGYNRYAQTNERQDREPENLKKKFMSLVNFKPSGDQEIPEDVRRAKKIHNQIEPQSVGEDDDGRFRKRKVPEPGMVDLRNWVPPNGGPPSKDQMKMMITQLASHHQHAQAQQQQAHQHLAHQLSMQYLSQQQQHKAIMMNMATSLAHHTRLLPGARELNLPPPLPPSSDWSSAATVAASTAVTTSVTSVKTLLIEEWSNTVNAESLSVDVKEAVLKASKAHGLSTVKDLFEALDRPLKELRVLLNCKPVEIARLKKTLSLLMAVPSKEEIIMEGSNIPTQLGVAGSVGLRPMPSMPSVPLPALFNGLPQTFNPTHPSQMLSHQQFTPLPPSSAHQPFHHPSPPSHLVNTHQAPPYSHMQPHLPSDFASLPPLPDSVLSQLSLEQPFLPLPQSLEQHLHSQFSHHLSLSRSLSPHLNPSSPQQPSSMPPLSPPTLLAPS